MRDFSILIPSRNEMFLNNTIQDILSNIEADTEIIVTLDGQWPVEPIPDNPRVILIYLSESIGQRAATNLACRISQAKYVMKCDAHCSFGKGFDRILMEDIEHDWTILPKMYNLHVFDWVCECGHRKYQGPTAPCEKCGKEMKREILWRAKPSPETTAMRFDTDLKFQYWSEYKSKQSGDLVETMSILGACWMLERQRYWDLNICDENHGGWGQQGTEVACKSWLSGGKLIVDKRTWFAHMFRTQGGDFGFPYPLSGKEVDKARNYSKKLWVGKSWDKAQYDLDWLIKKFNPPGWTEPEKKEEPKGLKRGIIYYTDNCLNIRLAKTVRKYINQSGLPIVSCTLKPTDFGKNIHMKEERGYKTMFKQILTALEASDADIIYFCEHDVLYHSSHFNFIPTDPNTFYYNGNYWMVRITDGFAIHYDVSPLSGLVGFRQQLITHFKERLELIKKKGFGYYMGFEPMTHKRIKWENWYNFEVFQPEGPNIDVAHEGNLTRKRWSQDKFIRKPKFWEESTVDKIPGWTDLRNILRIQGEKNG